ncbi:NapC/NirT family cytochrome c [Breoghania sp.]|uniref:NapC/NirT family cytochrome c n=1 Tax=Breoghania sp. TaxID=2065378 RepID=UPI00261930C7|nr:NapC/NirT family cytochrome c [Breoghania sp.]MDJ0932312.1 NapC/NirT family cytochrome c [Breoghania sp.]
MFRRLWGWFTRPVAIWGAVVVGVVGIAVGAVGYIGFHTVVEMTTTTEFCISCHTMRDNNFAEYKTTIHYKNPVGVRTECADCHVPKSGWPLYKAKILAARDLWGEITGTIDTREKFEKERLWLTQVIWDTMKANDSAQCRSCHSFEAMDFAHQKKAAAMTMKKAMRDGGTWIDCHKGIAHHLPVMLVSMDNDYSLE